MIILEDSVRHELISDLCKAMLKTCGDLLAAHGDDPHSNAVLAAATCMFINKVTLVDPHFKNVVRLLIK
jgi:hypothetical protein